jgi:hypothetical protein
VTHGRASREELSRRFAQHARAYGEHSPLYERLSLGIAEDGNLLDLAACARSVPPTNLFFAAVHLLLLGGARHPLAGFYDSVSEGALESGDPFPAFRSFCLEHAREIREILSTRRVQTNEVRRCALLLPAFGLAAQRAGRPLALVEVGASAGLNLLFDRYAYDYGDGEMRGESGSAVRLRCEIRGDRPPPLPDELPEVACRLGIDLNPLDVRDGETVRWLEALVWPEEFACRAPLLRRAISTARSSPPALLAGDALDLLPEVLANLPEGATPCVFHSFTLNQFPIDAREEFSAILASHASRRNLYRVSVEWLGGGDAPVLSLSRYAQAGIEEQTLARCDDHGEWLCCLETDAQLHPQPGHPSG